MSKCRNFAWGDTQGYSSASGHEFTLANYKYYNSESGVYTKYTTYPAILQDEDDAAVQILGNECKRYDGNPIRPIKD